MKVYEITTKQIIDRPITEVFDFFSRAENLSVVTPEKLGFQILTPTPIKMDKGTIIDYTIRLMGLRVRWRSLITAYEHLYSFTDEQIKGPYSFWHHTHDFRQTNNGVEITDRVRYVVPFGLLGRITNWLWIQHDLKQIFEYRRSVINELFSTEKYKLYTSDTNHGATA